MMMMRLDGWMDGLIDGEMEHTRPWWRRQALDTFER